MEIQMNTSNPRTMKLFCPSLSKIVSFVAWDEQKLDLGAIARTLGLDPWTLKLNGHFISRGVDFISSSVTWRSLLSFFSAKGLSTGEADSNPLVVDGKLSKVGTKRSREPQDNENGFSCAAYEQGGIGGGRPEPQERGYLLKNKKLRQNCSGSRDGDVLRSSKCKLLGSYKRKQLMEDVSLLKKLKINEPNSSADNVVGKEGSNDSVNSISCSTPLRCSCFMNMKRLREGDPIVAAPFKKD